MQLRKNHTLIGLIAACFLFAIPSYSQLTNGATAPDWTLDDTNDVIHNLYTELNAGKGALVEFSATWCGPCWNYHNTGVFKDIYNALGPNGTDEARVYYIEASSSTNEGCLFGPATCSGSTQGDWSAGTPYPLIHLDGSELAVASNYQVGFYPTIYAVSPDRRAFLVGQASYNTMSNWLTKSFKMAATANISDALCGTGSIDLVVTEGFGSKSYQWSNGSFSEDLVDVPAGTYTVKITDSNGYFIEETYTLNGPPQDLAVAYVNHSNVSCSGFSDGSISVNATGGWSNYSYQWDNGAIGNTASNLPGGFYAVTVTDNNGCTAVDFFEVTEPELLEAFSAVSDASCNENNGTIDVFSTGGTSPVFFEIAPGQGDYNGLFFQLSPGTYTTTLTDQNGCITTHMSSVGEIPPPISMANVSSDLNCTNTEVNLLGDGSSTGAGISYQWSTTDGNIVSGANSLQAVTDKAGEYTLSVSDAIGCIVTSNVIVAADLTAPTASIIGDNQLTCTVTELQLCVDTDAANTIQWTQGANNSTQTCILVNSAGNYAVEVMSANGCTDTALLEVTTSDEQPDVSITAPGVIDCVQTSTTMTAMIIGDPADYTISWTTLDGTIVGNTDQAMVTVMSSGSYTVEVTNVITGCTTSKIEDVVSEVSPAIASFDYAINNDGELLLENTSNVSDGINWDIDGTDIIDTDQVTQQFNEDGEYNICLTVSNECGPDTYCQTIEYVTVLVANASKENMLCFNDNKGNASVDLTGGRAPFMVEWAGPNGYAASGMSISNLTEGSYAYLATDDFGYSKEGTITIENAPELSVDMATGTDLSCYEDASGSVMVVASGGTGDLSYSWDNGMTTPNLSNLSAGDYIVSIIDANGCEISSMTTISQPDPLEVTSDGLTSVDCFGDTDAYLDLSTTGGTGAISYLWSDSRTTASIDGLGAGDISVMISDENNCMTTREYTISEPDVIAIDDVDVKDDINGAGGYVELEMIGGTGEYSYLWNTGATSRGIFGLEAGDYSCLITDDNGCMLQSETYTVSFLSAVEDIEGLESLAVFPNPVEEKLNINITFDYERNYELSIRDLQGKILYNDLLSNSHHAEVLDISHFASGVYILSITTTEASAAYKIIKQ